MGRVVIIQGHTNALSFCYALNKRAQDILTARGHFVDVIDLSAINFDPILHDGYMKIQPLEPDLVTAQLKISKADHLVIIYPTWWGTMPAMLKGFFDRTFLSGFAFKISEKTKLPIGLLKGKTAQIITTMDSPPWFYHLVMRNLGIRLLKKMILSFCGIKVTHTKIIGPVFSSTLQQKEKWLNDLEKILPHSI